MRMRKLFAGVVAAATMLGGLALGATTANAAAPTDQTITIQAGSRGVVAGHTFKYVQIAEYLDADSNEIQTVDAAKDAVKSAVEAALNTTVPADTDPLVWAQAVSGTPIDQSTAFPWSSTASSRTFADSLVAYAEANGTEVTADGEPYTISGLTGGLYVVVDVTEGAIATQKSLAMVVGTANKNFGTDGTVVVKNQKTNVPPTKTVTGDTDKTVSVGDTLSYTIEGTVPSTTGLGADYTYVFKDYASAGLSIDTAKTNVKVYAGDAETELDAAEYTVDPAGQTVTGDGTNVTFSVTLTKAALDKLQNVAGQKLVVKYDATVTEDAKTNPVTNSAEVVNGGNSSGQGTPVELYSNKFDFTKVFADGSKEGLTGAVFTVTDEAGKVVATASPDADGKVSFSGLKNGTYTVTETTVATGAQNVTGKFTVKLTYNETTKKTDAEYTVNNVTLDPYDLVKQDDKGAVTVTNVKSITQLPLTGAAGTALFTVIGLLLAGAAATVALKSRETKRALRA
ncbi:fimbrial subunit FimA [Bifidobacterium scardovii]|uniref:Fimbrial subunit FimA n=6 Tax=Bifidobacterium scardovii TaxID=158787 RepID=A0A087DDC9_9BIFI|nr:fimbrial subunit FimA [Bifidobacterium scardovii]